MCGLPGVGKSRWISENGIDKVVSLDEIRETLGMKPWESDGQLSAVAKQSVTDYLRSNKNFVVDATNIVKDTRARWINLFRCYNARVRIVYIEPEWSKLLVQNKNRTRPVPEDVVHGLFDKLDVPTLMECHSLEMVI